MRILCRCRGSSEISWYGGAQSLRNQNSPHSDLYRAPALFLTTRVYMVARVAGVGASLARCATCSVLMSHA
eukprot:5046877-Prymnesium_polylepis.1